MLVAAAATVLSVSMESAGLVYLKYNVYTWSFILLACHITLDILVCACLHPVVFVAFSSAGPLLALIMAKERTTAKRGFGIFCIISGVITSAALTAKPKQMCCSQHTELICVLISGAVAALVLSRTIYVEFNPNRGQLFRGALIACIAMISTLNLIAMEAITHCKTPWLAGVCVLLTIVEIACTKQSLRVSPISTHIPSIFGFYQIGGVAVQLFYFNNHSVGSMLLPLLAALFGIAVLLRT